MSALLYQLTVTDGKGKVLKEVVHTSPVILVQQLPEIKEEAEKLLKENENN